MSYPIEPVPAVPAPGRVGQATAVEQTRAAAEVLAAVQVAQQVPRDLAAAKVAMRQSCAEKALAERAFYRFPRGGQQVTGPTVHLARELARCFGNIQYGISELRRDDEYGQSEMQAWAWDVQTNTRVSSNFIVPHARDANGKRQKLTDLRDVYENNTNNGARRLREQIFSILPPWFVEEAKELCNGTLARGEGDKPLDQRIDEAIEAFGKRKVVLDQLEEKIGRPSRKWDGRDLATLEVIFQSLRRGELTVEDEFPPKRVTTAEITGQPAAVPATLDPAEDAAFVQGLKDAQGQG